MALSRVKVWGAGTLEFADLNAEFDNILNNALSLISPLTGNLAAGGFILTGLGTGSVSAPSVSHTGDSNTGVYFATDTVNIASGGVQSASFVTVASAVNFLTFTPSATGAGTTGPILSSAGTDANIGIIFAPKGTGLSQFLSAEAGAVGTVIELYHNSASPADNDSVGIIHFAAEDDGSVKRLIGKIQCVFDDVTATTMDSSYVFSTQSNVNAGDANTNATLSSIGVWTDASAARGKEYFSDMSDVIDKMRQIKTLGVYRAKDMPKEKHAAAEIHYSATAEDFFDIFKLGNDPAKGNPGIAPKDVAWLAVKMALELDDRVKTLEAA